MENAFLPNRIESYWIESVFDSRVSSAIKKTKRFLFIFSSGFRLHSFRFDPLRFATSHFYILLLLLTIHPSIHLACLPLIINCHRLLSSIHTRTPYATRQLWWRWPNHFMVWGYESSGGKEFLDTLLDPNDRQLRLGLLRIGISTPRAAVNRVSMSFGGAI